MLQKSPNHFLFRQENRRNCFIFVAIQVLSRFSQRKAIQEPTSNQKIYSTVSIESTILIFEIFRSGIAVAIKQAPTAKRVASRMGMTGIATSWRVSLVAASMKIVQTYPSTLPITEAMIP